MSTQPVPTPVWLLMMRSRRSRPTKERSRGRLPPQSAQDALAAARRSWQLADEPGPGSISIGSGSECLDFRRAGGDRCDQPAPAQQ